MNKERILRMADYMEAVAAKKYLQNRWIDGPVSSRKATFEKVGHEQYRVTPKEGFCGTAGCVMGHGATMPDMGLAIITYEDYLDKDSSGRRVATEFDIAFVHPEMGVQLEQTGYNAGALAFDIPNDHAEVMFGSGSSQTRAFYLGLKTWKDLLAVKGNGGGFHELVSPKMVADALRKYVETDGANMVEIDAFYD